MSFYLHEVGSQEKYKQLSRYIVAYDGDISTTIDENITHILCGEETTAQVKITLHKLFVSLTDLLLYRSFLISPSVAIL